MLCEKCNKNIANVYLKNTVNGNVTESHLCSSCAAELYGQNFNPFVNLFKSDFESDIWNMFNLNKSPQFQPSIAGKNACPGCGSSFPDIAKSGKIGCGECYATFRNALEPNILRIHGTSKHTGKIPKNMSLKISAKRKIEELNIKLKKMVDEQNFEEAAVIRDEINKINSESQSQVV
jgi:protein arginine kinase activator